MVISNSFSIFTREYPSVSWQPRSVQEFSRTLRCVFLQRRDDDYGSLWFFENRLEKRFYGMIVTKSHEHVIQMIVKHHVKSHGVFSTHNESPGESDVPWIESGSVAPRLARLHCPDDLQHFQSGAMARRERGQAVEETHRTSKI